MSSNSHSSNRSSDGHISVYVVDDHPAIQKAVQRAIEEVIDMEVCGISSSVEAAIDEIEEKNPDVAIVDISLEDGHGFDLLQQIRDQWPSTEAIIFSMYDEEIYAERALRTGASGYLMKSESIESLVEAIRRVADGKFYLSQRMYTRVLGGVVAGRSSEPRFRIDELTDREMQVFQMLGKGMSIEEIQEQLDIGRKTVETYRRRAKEKLGFDSVNELVQYAVQWSFGKRNEDPTEGDATGEDTEQRSPTSESQEEKRPRH